MRGETRSWGFGVWGFRAVVFPLGCEEMEGEGAIWVGFSLRDGVTYYCPLQVRGKMLGLSYICTRSLSLCPVKLRSISSTLTSLAFAHSLPASLRFSTPSTPRGCISSARTHHVFPVRVRIDDLPQQLQTSRVRIGWSGRLNF